MKDTVNGCFFFCFFFCLGRLYWLSYAPQLIRSLKEPKPSSHDSQKMCSLQTFVGQPRETGGVLATGYVFKSAVQ